MSLLPPAMKITDARPLAPLARWLRILYLYVRMYSALKCIKFKREGIEGMRAQIKADEADAKKWGEDVDAWGREIDALEKAK